MGKLMTWKVPVLRILVLFTRITSSSEFRQNPQCSVSIPIASLRSSSWCIWMNQRPWLSTWSLSRLGDTMYLQVISVLLNSSSDSNVPSMQLVPAILYVAQTRWLSRKVLALSDSWMTATVFHNIVLPNHGDIPISPPIYMVLAFLLFRNLGTKQRRATFSRRLPFMEKKYWCPWDSSRDWRQPLSVKGFSAWSRSVIIIWRNNQMASDPLRLWRNWEVSDTEIREGWNEKSLIETCVENDRIKGNVRRPGDPELLTGQGTLVKVKSSFQVCDKRSIHANHFDPCCLSRSTGILHSPFVFLHSWTVQTSGYNWIDS